MSVSIVSVVLLKGKLRLDVMMGEDILSAKSVVLEESVLIKGSEEFVLLDVGVSGIGFLRVDSSEVLSLKHVLELEAEVAEEAGEIEVEGGGLVVIVMLEDPESVDGMEQVVGRVTFINSLHFVAVEVVPQIVSNNYGLVQSGVEASGGRNINTVSKSEDVGVFNVLQGVGVNEDLTLK